MRTSRLVWRVVALGGAVAVWQLVSLGLGPSVVPGPVAVLEALVDLVPTPEFWSALGETLGSTLVGLGIATVLAVPLGLIVGSSTFLRGSTRLTVDFLRTIPPVTLIPLTVLLFGPSWAMQVVLIVFGSIWPLFLQATYAIREMEPIQRDMAAAFRLRRSVWWTQVSLPSSLPFLVTGVRVASTIALLLAIAAELVGNAPGIGREIALAQMSAQVPTAYAYVVVAALLGVAMNLATGAASRGLLFWHPSVRSQTVIARPGGAS